jgi:hypothetical protein
MLTAQQELSLCHGGPKGERRPADVIGNAVKVMRIATGEEPEDYGPSPEAGGIERSENAGPERPEWELKVA